MNIRFCILISIITCEVFTFEVIAQEQLASSSTDLTGSWSGISQAGLSKLQNRLKLVQNGTVLNGTMTVNSMDKKEHTVYEVNGYLEDDKIKLKGVKFLEKEGLLWCLPTLNLKVNEEGVLEGKWKPNMVKGGCLPPLSGKMELVKEVAQKESVAEMPVVQQSTLDEDDFEGKELIKALKKRKYYALVIGVEEYDDDEIVDLEQPVSDAEKLLDVLKNRYHFEEENIKFLKNPGRTEIIESFDQLANTVSSVDNFLIFYAGHGIWDERLEQGFWLPKDASKNSKAQWLSNGTIRDYLRAIKAKHTLLIADACFSGGILKERNAFTSSKAMLEMYKRPSRKAMTSGALKTVPDKSVFIEYLIKNLEYNQAPLLSADKLYSDFKHSVINNSLNGQVPQYGVIQNSDDEGGEFIFLRNSN